MNDLQKIIVLCLVLGAGAIGFFIGSQVYDQDKSVSLDSSAQSGGDVLNPRGSIATSVWDGASDESEPFIPKTRNEIIVTSFDTCVAAGNPVMESYPRKCTANGHVYTEIIGTDDSDDESETNPDDTFGIACTKPERMAEACTMQYDPVCAYVRVECITEPCPPVPETYGNACEACRNERVVSYTRGACENGT